MEYTQNSVQRRLIEINITSKACQGLVLGVVTTFGSCLCDSLQYCYSCLESKWQHDRDGTNGVKVITLS